MYFQELWNNILSRIQESQLNSVVFAQSWWLNSTRIMLKGESPQPFPNNTLFCFTKFSKAKPVTILWFMHWTHLTKRSVSPLHSSPKSYLLIFPKFKLLYSTMDISGNAIQDSRVTKWIRESAPSTWRHSLLHPSNFILTVSTQGSRKIKHTDCP